LPAIIRPPRGTVQLSQRRQTIADWRVASSWQRMPDMRLSRFLPLLIALFTIVAPARVSAQSLFIDGAISADIERRASYDVSGISALETQHRGGTVPGGTLAIGTMLNPAFSVRFEMHWQGTLESSFGDITPYTTRTLEASEQLSTGSVLVGYHTPRRGSVQFTYLGGVTFAVLNQDSTSTYEYNLPILLANLTIPPGAVLPVPYESTLYESTSYGVTAQVGFDADVSVTPRFSVVPQVRAFATSGMLSIRTGIAARLKW
jgi:hypothetical protein